MTTIMDTLDRVSAVENGRNKESTSSPTQEPAVAGRSLDTTAEPEAKKARLDDVEAPAEAKQVASTNGGAEAATGTAGQPGKHIRTLYSQPWLCSMRMRTLNYPIGWVDHFFFCGANPYLLYNLLYNDTLFFSEAPVQIPATQGVVPGMMNPHGNMFMHPAGGIPSVAAMNYQGLLLQSQFQGNNGSHSHGSMPAQQMWMNHPVLAQALGLNFRQAAAANGQNGMASLQGLHHPGMFGQQMQASVDINSTGRVPSVLYMSCDDDSLSEYQCVVRKQIELFEARREDVESNAQGRNRPIVMGQVGIRCRHCTMLPPKHRARGAIYYPAKLHGLYQAAQNMASSHLCEHCQHVPPDVRAELLKLRDRKSSAGGGKKYWADGVRVLGVFEDSDGLRFGKP